MCTTGNSSDRSPGGRNTPAGAASAAMPWVCLRSTITGELQGKIISKSTNESGPFALFVSGEISEQQYKQFIIIQ